MESVRRRYADLRAPALIISSVCAQILLMAWSHPRIRNSFRSPLRRSIWIGIHVATDYYATLSLWLIFHVYMEPNVSQEGPQRYYLAYWAPFTLLHLGRHAKITAFSLQDNEFWPRQAVYFVLQMCATFFVCIIASMEFGKIWPSIMVFVVCALKFCERICSLHYGSLYQLKLTLEKPDPGVDIHEILREINNAQRRGEIRSPPPYQHEIDMPEAEARRIWSEDTYVRSLCEAYTTFNTYKGLYADVRLTPPSRNTPGNPSATQIEHELGFAYDLFYSKRVVTHSLTGLIVRVVTVLSIPIAATFYERKDKHLLYTIILPILSLALELACLVEAALSRWTLVKAGFQEGERWRKLERKILGMRQKLESFSSRPYLKLGQHSISGFCANDQHSQSRMKRLIHFFELKEFWDNTMHTNYVRLHNELKQRIIEQIRARLREEWNCINAAGQNAVLAPLSKSVAAHIGERIKIIVIQHLKFGEALIVLHLATDLCCRQFSPEELHPDLRDANVISNYMMYLLVEHPSTLSSVEKPETLYKDACAAVKQFMFENNDNRDSYYSIPENLCNGITNSLARGSSFLLVDGYRIAYELMRRSRKQQQNDRYYGSETWKLLFKVWVDLLAHAAYYCKGKDHAQRLSTGGELLTYVWVFLLHSFIG